MFCSFIGTNNTGISCSICCKWQVECKVRSSLLVVSILQSVQTKSCRCFRSLLVTKCDDQVLPVCLQVNYYEVYRPCVSGMFIGSLLRSLSRVSTAPDHRASRALSVMVEGNGTAQSNSNITPMNKSVTFGNTLSPVNGKKSVNTSIHQLQNQTRTPRRVLVVFTLLVLFFYYSHIQTALPCVQTRRLSHQPSIRRLTCGCAQDIKGKGWYG